MEKFILVTEFTRLIDGEEKLEEFLKKYSGQLTYVEHRGSWLSDRKEVKLGRVDQFDPHDGYTSTFGMLGALKRDIRFSLEQEFVLRGDDPVIDIIEVPEGVEAEHRGRSGFAARNAFVMKAPAREIEILVVRQCGLNYKDLSWDEFGFNEDEARSYGFSEVEVTKELMSVYDHTQIVKAVEAANAKIAEAKGFEIIQKFNQSSEDGGITGWVEIGGHSGLKEEYIPEGYKLIFKYRTANTLDHRRKLDHTYNALLVKMDKIGRALKLSIPDGLKGVFIGKGGQNIKAVQAKLGVKVIIG